MRLLFTLILFLISSCTPRYSLPPPISQPSPYSLTIYVDARHLKYNNACAFLKSLQNQSSTNYGRFGHAWIRLQAPNETILEGGHSGERGLANPQYFDGVMDLVDAHDPNPIRYLWTTQPDGYFESGSGNHKPTYAATVPLNEDQYLSIKSFIDSQNYTNYSITQGQCASFAAQAAALANLNLEYEITLEIPREITFAGRKMILWTDPIYSKITFGSPDALEKSLRRCVRAGLAEEILIERECRAIHSNAHA